LSDLLLSATGLVIESEKYDGCSPGNSQKKWEAKKVAIALAIGG
jgi:hypothetical protein